MSLAASAGGVIRRSQAPISVSREGADHAKMTKKRWSAARQTGVELQVGGRAQSCGAAIYCFRGRPHLCNGKPEAEKGQRADFQAAILNHLMEREMRRRVQSNNSEPDDSVCPFSTQCRQCTSGPLTPNLDAFVAAGTWQNTREWLRLEYAGCLRPGQASAVNPRICRLRHRPSP
jgi:hypothetical protein